MRITFYHIIALHDDEEERIAKKLLIIKATLAFCLCVSLFLVGFIVDFSTGDVVSHGGSSLNLSNNPFQTTNETTVKISIGYTPARGVVLYCIYTITDSNQKVVDSSLMWHLPFSSKYVIDKTLTDLANGTYTFKITAHYADGKVHTTENRTFTVDTAFKYPALAVLSPQNQTYNSNQVDLIYNVNSKVLMSYYKLDRQDWKSFSGNITLSKLSNGSHTLVLSVVTEANRRIAQANEAQTVCFNVNSP